jgi:hypothetical protein
MTRISDVIVVGGLTASERVDASTQLADGGDDLQCAL